MRILVTGGAGFIGSAVCRRLAGDERVNVLNVDILNYAACPQSLDSIAGAPNYRFAQGDIADGELISNLLAEFKPNGVMHLAAESHVDRSITGSAAFVRSNIVGTHVLLECALSYWDKLGQADKEAFRFVHVSTDEVFGSLGEEGAFVEDTPYDPRSPYSASKAASDHLANAWHHTYGLPVIVTNCSNNYGPYQFPEKLIPLAVYGDGRNVRDWLFVDDHVEGLISALGKGAPGRKYNFGGRSERANIEVVHLICDVLDEMAPLAGGGSRRRLVHFVSDRPGHDRRYAIDPARAEAELGWSARESFESGIRRTVSWYLERRDWWEPIRTQRFAGERLGLRDVG
jgi:dTDP-glucose 4,6-dehydratase